MTFTVHVQVRVGNDKGETKWKTMELGHPVGALKNPSGKLHSLSLTSTLSDALSSGCICVIFLFIRQWMYAWLQFL